MSREATPYILMGMNDQVDASQNQTDQTRMHEQEHIRLLEKLINPALFEDGVTRLNFILMAVVEAKNVAPLVARISKLK